MEWEVRDKLISSFPTLQSNLFHCKIIFEEISDDAVILLRHLNSTYPLSVIVRDSELLRKADVNIVTVQKGYINK